MSVSAAEFTQRMAGRWIATAVPSLVTRVLLPLGWVTAVVAAVLGDNQRCTPVDPAVCGPDQGLAFWIVVGLATPVLLWWRPVLGCVAGVAFAAADLTFDDVTAARIGFGVHGAACLATVLWMASAGARQRRVAADSTSGAPVRGRADPYDGPSAAGLNLLLLAAAVALLIGAAASAVVYRHRVGIEQGHLDRAVHVTGRVSKVDSSSETYSITLTWEAGSDAGEQTRSVEVLDTAVYRIGDKVPALLDRSDRDWVRLVAEPADETYWLSLAYGATLLALLLLGRELRARAARTTLATGEHPLWAVRVIPDDRGRVLVLPAEEPRGGASTDHGGSQDWVTHAFARFPAIPVPVRESVDGHDRNPNDDDTADDDDEWTPHLQASFGRAWRGQHELGDEPFLDGTSEPEDATLVGDLRVGGWVAVTVGDTVLLPDGPLTLPPGRRILPPGVRRWLLPEDDDDFGDRLARGELPGTALDPVPLPSEPELPVALHGPTTMRVLGWAGVAAAFVGGPLAELYLTDGWWSRVGFAFFAANLLAPSVTRAVAGVELTRQALRVRTGTAIHEVAWGRLHGVRLVEDHLALAWEPDVVMEIAPLNTARLFPGTPKEQAEQLGSWLNRLRERGGLTVDPPAWKRRPGPFWPLVVIIVLACAGAALTAARAG